MVNQQIHITSISKAISNAKIYGKLDMSIIELYSLYNDCIYFAQEKSDLGSTQFDDYIVYLKNEAAKLVYKYPKDLCNYKVIIPNDNITTPIVLTNTAPTVDNNTVNLNTDTTYQFTVGDFTLNYFDSEYEGYKYLLIYPLTSSTYGNLKTTYNTVEVTSPIIINIFGLSSSTSIDLYYNRTDFTAFGPDVFNFRVSDSNTNYLYSLIHTLGVSGALSSNNNLPPENIGDITLYIANRVNTTLTMTMFTTGLVDPYTDPEGDLIDAIRIVDISNANQGIYYLNGTPIIEGQIITREDIEAGLFIHSGPNTDSASSDVFEFEIRDEGSGIWIG